MRYLNQHIVTTIPGIEAQDVTDALASAGIEATTGAAHLQGVARLAAMVLADYSPEQRAQARASLDRWIDEVLGGEGVQ